MLSLPAQVPLRGATPNGNATTTPYATLRALALSTLPYGGTSGTATTPGTPMLTPWAPVAAPALGEDRLGWACIDMHVTAFANAPSSSSLFKHCWLGRRARAARSPASAAGRCSRLLCRPPSPPLAAALALVFAAVAWQQGAEMAGLGCTKWCYAMFAIACVVVCFADTAVFWTSKVL